jgi:hypothetical protein
LNILFLQEAEVGTVVLAVAAVLADTVQTW